MKTSLQVQHITPKCDKVTAMQRLTGSIGGRFGLFVETIWNSHEHGEADRIDITVNGRGQKYSVSILDNGRGMNQARRERSLNLAMTAEGGTSKRNYQDLGLKRAAAEFKQVCVLTICVEDQQDNRIAYPMWEMKYDFDTLFDILADRSKATIAATPLSTNYSRMGLPEGSTGTLFQFMDARPDRPHISAEILRKDLPNHLPPRIAKKVFVNGLPLERREIVGEPFEMTIDNHPTLGHVEIDLYIPKGVTSRDRLTIGPYEGVCDWRTFLRDLSPGLLNDELNILDGNVFGDFRIEALSRFVTASRLEFDVSLFGSPVPEQIVEFVAHQICPKVSDMLGLIKRTAKDEHDKMLLEQLSKYAEGVRRGPDKRAARLILTLNTSAIEVVPNQRPAIDIEVDQYNENMTLAWDVSTCGGKAQVSSNNKKVSFLPGAKTGVYTLTCFYKENEDVRATVNIAIVAVKKLRVHPQRMTVQPGRTVTLTAINWEVDSSGEENLRWKIDPNDKEGFFVVDINNRKQNRKQAHGAKAVYQAGYTCSTYQIKLIDSQQDHKEVLVDITVAERTPRDSNEYHGGNPGEVMIEGRSYILGFEYMEASNLLSRLYTGARGREVRINRCHPGSKHAEKVRGDEGLISLALHELLTLHIDEEARVAGEDLTATERNRRRADLYKAVVEMYERNSQ
ncbi:MAG TPA: hypothetical protein VLG69_04150 [Candidatus Andersenbacteria bacterium]|nr:hypothetical protein [Candidatus Andersenbacteria bacterium]